MIELDKKQIKIILTEMCKVVGTKYNKIDFQKKNWFHEYTWSMAEQTKFENWLSNKLVKWHNMYISSAIKKAKWFIFDYGWKLNE